MPDLIDFEEALARTADEDRALLIGNGFSAEYFNYRDLLDKSGLEPGTPVRDLFDALGTVDFETVVRTLEATIVVERVYGQADHANQIEADAQTVREALVNSISSTHPAHRDELAFKYDSSAAFLGNFSTVFTLNYDLLLYWVNLEKLALKDGFGLGKPAGSFHGPFSEEAYCHIYNLHGGLHLFESGAGEIMKAVHQGAGVIATISKEIVEGRRFPLYVAEGTSSQKMRKINSVAYLRHCYDTLRANSAVLFVFGHSADENDAHIYRAIFASEAKQIFFGVFHPTDEKLKALDGQLAKYQRTAGSTTEYVFFDSESARVWNA